MQSLALLLVPVSSATVKSSDCDKFPVLKLEIGQADVINPKRIAQQSANDA